MRALDAAASVVDGSSDRVAGDVTLTEGPASDLTSTPDSGCSVTTYDIPAAADSLINSVGNNFGRLTVMNIGVGRALIRFAVVDQELAGMLLANDPRVRGFSLLLTRAQDDSDRGGAAHDGQIAGTESALSLPLQRDAFFEGRTSGASWFTQQGSVLEVAVIVEMNTGAYTIASRDNQAYPVPVFTVETCR